MMLLLHMLFNYLFFCVCQVYMALELGLLFRKVEAVYHHIV
jgi:hypothetical protein